MRGSAAFRTGAAPGGALAPRWSKDRLWRAARATPSLDQNFADSKSLTDGVTGQNLVTFTRSGSATYVDSTGTLRSAVTNLLLRSEEFDNAVWGPTSGTVSANQTLAPSGAATADKLIAPNGGSQGQIFQSLTITSGSTVTGSIYAKGSGLDRLELVLLSNNNTTPYGRSVFNLNTGAVTTAAFTQNGGTNASSNVQVLGNDWYRFSVTVTYPAVTAAGMRVSVFNADSSNGDGVKGVFLWGAQLEQSSTAGEYVPATSTINSAPRFDHNPLTGESLGLLVEEQRTNLLLNSATLSTQNVTVTAAAHTLSFTGTGTVTLSGTSTAGPLVGTGTGEANRVSLTFTPTAGTLTLTVSGTVSNAQLELGSFRTSYIPTTSAAATRSADVASITGSNFSSWYRQDEWTVFADFNGTNIASGQFPRLAELNDGTSSNIIRLQQYSNNAVRASITASGAGQFAADSGIVAVGTRGKVAFGSALNDAALVTNGISPTTDTSYLTTAGISQLGIGGPPSGSTSVLNSTIRRLAFWPQRLPNSTLQAITQ